MRLTKKDERWRRYWNKRNIRNGWTIEEAKEDTKAFKKEHKFLSTPITRLLCEIE